MPVSEHETCRACGWRQATIGGDYCLDCEPLGLGCELCGAHIDAEGACDNCWPEEDQDAG